MKVTARKVEQKHVSIPEFFKLFKACMQAHTIRPRGVTRLTLSSAELYYVKKKKINLTIWSPEGTQLTTLHDAQLEKQADEEVKQKHNSKR